MSPLCRAMVRHERASLTPGDLTLPQVWALEIMRDRGGCAMHALVAELQLKSSTGTMFVDRLVEAGLARRERDRADRRAVQVAITAAGRRILEASEQHKLQTLLKIYQPFTRPERKAYLALLDKLVRELSNSLTKEG